MTDVLGRYFCHVCNAEKDRVREDYTCPTCSSGAVEEMPERLEPEPPRAPAGLEGIFPGLMAAALDDFPPHPMGGSSRRGGGARFHMHSDGPMRPLRSDTAAMPMFPGHDRGAMLGGPDRQFENFLQEVIMNVTGMGVAGGGGGGRGGGSVISFHMPHMGGLDAGLQIHGNPGDYAWGRGGLDTIITQLLNQMEGAGPPPMTKDNINEIPTVELTQELLDKNPNCSVCWEEFKLEENVLKLECNHCFHKDCLVPWLELHGTCPVCRKVLIQDKVDQHSSDSTNQGISGEDASSADIGGSSAAPGTSQSTNNSTSNSDGQGGSGLGMTSSTSLSGFLQNTLSSILGVNLSPTSGGGSNSSSFEERSQQSPPTSGTTSSTSGSAGTTTTTSSSSAPGSRAGTTRSPPPGDEDTPASRRQRLNSDFVDFDLE